jgi:hypothetical protein
LVNTILVSNLLLGRFDEDPESFEAFDLFLDLLVVDSGFGVSTAKGVVLTGKIGNCSSIGVDTSAGVAVPELTIGVAAPLATGLL